MAMLQIKIDEELRDRAKSVFKGLGMDISTAVRVFLTQSVRDNALPFTPKGDPFYSPSNVEHLKKVLDDIKRNKNVIEHPLIADEL